MASKPHAELVLRTGQTILFDAEHLEAVSKYKWVSVMRKGKSQVMTRSRGFTHRTIYLGRVLFKYRISKEIISFKNGNRYDFRSENVEILVREVTPKATLPSTVEVVNEVRMNGCLLRPAPEGSRCEKHCRCEGYDACLDYISHRTEWNGWDASPAD